MRSNPNVNSNVNANTQVNATTNVNPNTNVNANANVNANVNANMKNLPHLAWHETLQLHELVAFQASSLVKLKMAIKEVHDPALKSLYAEAIKCLESNLRELIAFYPRAPHPNMPRDKADMKAEVALSADLLGITKSGIRNYAIAISETATPQLRDVLTKQLVAMISLHGKVFNYMLERDIYPAYHLDKLLANDLVYAKHALSL
jgi:spore coat protein F